jgi:hypothetical protein
VLRDSDADGRPLAGLVSAVVHVLPAVPELVVSKLVVLPLAEDVCAFPGVLVLVDVIDPVLGIVVDVLVVCEIAG